MVYWAAAGSEIATADSFRRGERVASRSARRTKPALWESVKARILAGDRGGLPGQWSARKAQLAVLEYKQRGGGYIGQKTSDLGLVKWTRQDWRTKSGKPSLETGERYLPAKAIKALSSEEYAETTREKRRAMRSGKQFSRQPPEVARKVARYRRNPGPAIWIVAFSAVLAFEILKRRFAPASDSTRKFM